MELGDDEEEKSDSDWTDSDAGILVYSMAVLIHFI
jgi:hypothetical protein